MPQSSHVAAWSLALLGMLSLPPSVVIGEDAADPIGSCLERAGDNRAQIQQALDDVPAAQREAMHFLVRNMPDRDLRSLTGEFLLANVRLAYQVWEECPWKNDVPPDIFFNDVLPYASINERRDNWRQDFYARFRPLVKDARTPSAAAALLNQKIFAELNVRYSTQRPKADQSPTSRSSPGRRRAPACPCC